MQWVRTVVKDDEPWFVAAGVVYSLVSQLELFLAFTFVAKLTRAL